MWSDCGYYPASTIRTLVQRSLVRINENGQFWMHDHVRDLGRAIVFGENNQNPYKRSRIWSNRDAISMLKNREGNDFVEALRIDMKGEDYVLTNKEFKQFSRLRYLELWNGRLAGNFKEILPNIRWLRLCGCNSFPTLLNLKNLVILGLENCPVRDGWTGWNEIKVARKLKVLNLTRCTYLEKVPDLFNCKAIELLDFCGCRKMQGELDIGNFKNLRLLVVKRTRITNLKGDIGRLQNLQKIDVSHTGLIELPAGISKLSSLEILDLTLTDPNKPDLTEMLPDSLKSLAISSSSLPVLLPSSLSYLDICYCDQLQRLPNLANLSNLTGLCLKEVGICELPGLGELKQLATLNLCSASNLDNLDGLENLLLLKELSIQHCRVLEKLPSLANLTKLHKLEIGWCPLLAEIHGLGELRESLSILDISGSGQSGLAGIEALRSMVKLEILVFQGLELANMLQPSLSMFTKLRRLAINRMSLKRFPDLSSLKNLRDLRIQYCPELIEVTGLDTLEWLERLVMNSCRSMRKLQDLSGLKRLKHLDVTGCTVLTEVSGLGRLEALEKLYMSHCESIRELPNLSGLRNLRRLRLKKCRQLKEVNGLEGLELLEVFEMDKTLNVKYVLKSAARYWN